MDTRGITGLPPSYGVRRTANRHSGGSGGSFADAFREPDTGDATSDATGDDRSASGATASGLQRSGGAVRKDLGESGRHVDVVV